MATTVMRVRLIKMKFAPRAKGSRKAISRAMDEIVEKMDRAVHRGLDTPYPPPSRPWRKPHMRTPIGGLYDKTKVTRVGHEIQVRTTQYGVYLEGGTSKMRPRPFIRPVIHNRKAEWSKKLTKAIKKYEED
jgi:HK97 gp10 family phage protein